LSPDHLGADHRGLLPRLRSDVDHDGRWPLLQHRDHRDLHLPMGIRGHDPPTRIRVGRRRSLRCARADRRRSAAVGDVRLAPDAEGSRLVSHSVAVATRSARTRRVGWWLLVAVLVAVVLLWVFPFIWMVSASLKSPAEIFAGGLSLIPESPVWENYRRAWVDGSFNTYLLNTVIITVATTVIVVVRCALAGYVLGRYRSPGSRLILGI